MKIFFPLLLLVIAFMVTPTSAKGMASTEAKDINARLKSQENVQGMIQSGKLTAPIPRVTKQAERQETVADRCVRVTAKIDSRLNFYDDKKGNYNNRYMEYQAAVTQKASDWKKAGCNTAIVDADLVTLGDKLTAFAAAFRDFHTTLEGSRAYVCGESQGKFAGQVNMSRQKLLAFKASAATLRDFVNNTMRPHVKAARALCEPKNTPHPTLTGDRK
jgi:hypothetical protein